jgi:hypothetical protein
VTAASDFGKIFGFGRFKSGLQDEQSMTEERICPRISAKRRGKKHNRSRVALSTFLFHLFIGPIFNLCDSRSILYKSFSFE